LRRDHADCLRPLHHLWLWCPRIQRLRP
jgi:hypothetical protein